MTELNLQIEGDRTSFAPGETIRGEANWILTRPAPKIELRLCWFTQGMGTPEALTVETLVFAQPSGNDRQPFQFKLPAFPFSFRGALIQLEWALELIAFPSQETARRIIVIGPRRERILIGGRALPPPLPALPAKAA